MERGCVTAVQLRRRIEERYIIKNLFHLKSR
jgi:hypothetical protein